MLAWHLEKSGVFSVRSAYRLGLDIQRSAQSNASSTAPDGDGSLWKGLWSRIFAVPPKICMFAWKLCRDIHPAKKNKHKGRRGRVADSDFPAGVDSAYNNNLTHNSGNTKIADSVFFVLNYSDTLLQVRQQNQPEDAK